MTTSDRSQSTSMCANRRSHPNRWVYEVVTGGMRATNERVYATRWGVGGVQSLNLNETIALEGARIQADLRTAGDELAARDLLIAATARLTSAELVVANKDIERSRSADDTTMVPRGRPPRRTHENVT